jgi:hypothetical protein
LDIDEMIFLGCLTTKSPEKSFRDSIKMPQRGGKLSLNFHDEETLKKSSGKEGE